MNNARDLAPLLEISQIRYDQQRQAFALIVQRENSLRAELNRLALLDQAEGQPADAFREMRAIGADVQWQAWLARARRTLNMQLARVLALKAHEQDKVRRAFGKLTALQNLLDEERAKISHQQAQAALARAIDHAVFGGAVRDQ